MIAGMEIFVISYISETIPWTTYLAVITTIDTIADMRAEFYGDLGFDPTEYDMEVFRKTNEISKQVFPLTLDIDNPRFKKLLDQMVANTQGIEAARKRGGLFGKIGAASRMARNALCFARLYLIRPIPNALPEDFRLVPSY